MKKSERIVEALLRPVTEGIHIDGGKIYVDTAFLNGIGKLGSSYNLKHMGFGEFSVDTPLGEVEVNRMAGKEFEGMSGRSHLLYDTKGGTKAAEALVHAMKQHGG